MDSNKNLDYDNDEFNKLLYEDMVTEEAKNLSACHIKFTRNKRKLRVKLLSKMVIFIVIAASSGALSGLYIVNLKYNRIMKINNRYLAQIDISDNTGSYHNVVGDVARTVTPTIVGISRKINENIEEGQRNGSGIIFSEDGYIVTNYNIIDESNEISVKTYDGKTYEAKVIGVDDATNLAVIKIDGTKLPTAKLGDSSKVKVGDLAIAIGNPLGNQFVGSVSVGIVSGLNRKRYSIDNDSGSTNIYKVFQTDAAINKSNSGGALCNQYGEVIGINNLTKNNEYGIEGMGFALSINEVKNIAKSLMEYGYVSRGAIGIYGGSAISSDNNGIEGIYIQKVIKGSEAEIAGIRPTDIIIEVDGVRIKDMQKLGVVLEKHKIGDQVSCKIWRNGKTIKLNMNLFQISDN